MDKVKIAITVSDATMMRHCGGDIERTTHILEVESPMLARILEESRQQNSMQTVSLSIVGKEFV